MNRFGNMLRQLEAMTDNEDRQHLLVSYLDSLPEDDLRAVASFLSTHQARGPFPARKLRTMLEQHWGKDLFSISHAYVGNLAETISLLWPQHAGANRPVTPAELSHGLHTAGSLELPARISHWLSGADTAGRHAIVRIVTGTLRKPVPEDLLAAVFPRKGVHLPARPAAQEPGTQAELFSSSTIENTSPGQTEAALLYVERSRAGSPRLICTFGLWSGSRLVPVARLEAGEFSAIVETFLARHTTRRFGPTHEVSHDDGIALVATIEFAGIDASNRNRAGITLRTPRLVALTTPATAQDADDIAGLTSRLPTAGSRVY
jgi:ATP-dependent DNA ligase